MTYCCIPFLYNPFSTTVYPTAISLFLWLDISTILKTYSVLSYSSIFSAVNIPDLDSIATSHRALREEDKMIACYFLIKGRIVRVPSLRLYNGHLEIVKYVDIILDGTMECRILAHIFG